jgi:hypothetical protein
LDDVIVFVGPFRDHLIAAPLKRSMEVYAYGRMHPLYEAMTVCSETIEWLARQEKERNEAELQSSLGNMLRVMEEFTRAASSSDLLADASPDTMIGSIYCLEAVNSMTKIITRETFEKAPTFSERFRESIKALLAQVEPLTEKIEGILEAWQISVDPALSARLTEAVKRVDGSKTDISNWREALELIHD